MTIDFIAFKFKSKQMFKIKNAIFFSFRFIHLSKVCKLDEKRSTELHKNSTKLSSIQLKEENNLSRLLFQLTRRKAI